MKLVIFLLSILGWKLHEVAGETCSHPDVSRTAIYIYRTADVDVTVYHCFYIGTNPYSDITKHCIEAFDSGIYTDKWSSEHYIRSESPIKVAKYTTKANPVQNEIKLRSGTICRYDRGFCYDPKESINFAVVWKVTHQEPQLHADKLIKLFYGWVDIWQLRNNSLKYLVYQNVKKDQSFALQLVEKHEFRGREFWYTDQHGLIASEENLTGQKGPILRLDEDYFPLNKKQFISEQILRSCDLQNFPFDFERSGNKYDILDQDNLATILDSFQNQILETKKKLSAIPTNGKENPSYSKAITELQKELGNTKSFVLANEVETVQIQGSIKELRNTLAGKDVEFTRQLEKIKQLFAKQQGNDAEMNKVREKLIVLENKLASVRNESYGLNINKQVANLEQNLTIFGTIVLKENKNILNLLRIKDNEIDGIKKALGDVYVELQKKDRELKTGQDSISNRLFNLELDSNRHDNELTKCQNVSRTILEQLEKNFKPAVKDQNDKLEQKYNSILAKLNLHDKEISKCQNFTTFLLPNKDTLLKEIEKSFRNIEGVVLQVEGKIVELQNKDDSLEKGVYDRDRELRLLKEDVVRDHKECNGKLNNMENEIKSIKERNKQHEIDIDGITNLYRDVHKNLTDAQNTLLKQNKDIFDLGEILKPIQEKLKTIDKDLASSENECKNYVNTRLKSITEEFTAVHGFLIKNDREIKELQENLEKNKARNNDLENKINKCQDDTGRELKKKDEELKRIRYSLTIKDEQYKKLENEIKEIKKLINVVDPV